jgi:hypothetical protein
MGKRKVYMNTRPVGVLSYKRVTKRDGIRYITYDTEREILDRISSIDLEEDSFDRLWDDYNVTKLLLSENKTV